MNNTARTTGLFHRGLGLGAASGRGGRGGRGGGGGSRGTASPSAFAGRTSSQAGPSGTHTDPMQATEQQKRKGRVFADEEEEPEPLDTAWSKGPQVVLNEEEGCTWRWTVYPNILYREQEEPLRTYGAIVWGQEFHKSLLERTRGRKAKLKDIVETRELVEGDATMALAQSWVLPLVSSIG